MKKNNRTLKADFKRSELEIKKRLKDFASIRKDAYFYELMFCILTPQSSARNAMAVVEELQRRDFQNRDIDCRRVLSNDKNYIRFHNNKSSYLRFAKKIFPEILKAVGKLEAAELREWLVRNVKGLGWKEASHFLRNIGYRNLAILDRHILKNLLEYGVINEIPSILTKKKYAEIEKKFLLFSKRAGIEMDELDLFFWKKQTGEILK